MGILPACVNMWTVVCGATYVNISIINLSGIYFQVHFIINAAIMFSSDLGQKHENAMQKDGRQIRLIKGGGNNFLKHGEMF